MIPYLYDLSNTNVDGMTVACNTEVWLMVLGGSIILSSFFSKTHRINKIIKSSAQLKRITIKIRDATIPMAVLVTLNVLILSIMAGIDSITYQLLQYGPVDSFGRTVQVYGRCDYEHVRAFGALLGILNGGMLCLCAYQAWHARTLSTEFQETQYILSALLVLGGVFTIGFPVVRLNDGNPNIRTFITAVILFASCISILFIMFVPKIRYKETKEPRIMISGVTTTTPIAGIGNNSATDSNVSPSGSINYGEKILTNKTHKQLLTEISTLRRRLGEQQKDVESQDMEILSSPL